MTEDSALHNVSAETASSKANVALKSPSDAQAVSVTAVDDSDASEEMTTRDGDGNLSSGTSDTISLREGVCSMMAREICANALETALADEAISGLITQTPTVTPEATVTPASEEGSRDNCDDDISNFYKQHHKDPQNLSYSNEPHNLHVDVNAHHTHYSPEKPSSTTASDQNLNGNEAESAIVTALQLENETLRRQSDLLTSLAQTTSEEVRAAEHFEKKLKAEIVELRAAVTEAEETTARMRMQGFRRGRDRKVQRPKSTLSVLPSGHEPDFQNENASMYSESLTLGSGSSQHFTLVPVMDSNARPSIAEDHWQLASSTQAEKLRVQQSATGIPPTLSASSSVLQNSRLRLALVLTLLAIVAYAGYVTTLAGAQGRVARRTSGVF